MGSGHPIGLRCPMAPASIELALRKLPRHAHAALRLHYLEIGHRRRHDLFWRLDDRNVAETVSFDAVAANDRTPGTADVGEATTKDKGSACSLSLIAKADAHGKVSYRGTPPAGVGQEQPASQVAKSGRSTALSTRRCLSCGAKRTFADFAEAITGQSAAHPLVETPDQRIRSLLRCRDQQVTQSFPGRSWP